MFSILCIPVSLSLRHPEDTLFTAETFSNRQLWLAYGWIVAILILVTELPLLQKIFDTGPLTLQQWRICLVAVVFYLIVSEILKWILRLVKR